MIGKTVSHYRIVGSLGAGGMGVVYSGEDVRLGRSVALKFVPEDLARDPQAVARLNSEARTASGLNHPNICTIYDIGEHDGQPFIVMELLQGQTLRERLEGGPLRIRDAVELGIHVADALDAAHHRSIIHRDIKPANLFLVDRGQVKVLDFGLAKPVSRNLEGETTERVTRDRTAEGVTLGTVAYMSPEQVTGEELDGRSDIFSLGVVLYEALTGHQPFTGKTSAVIFSAILTRAPVAPVMLNPEMPLRLQEVVNNCLEKDRELRYQNAADLRADLKRVRRDLESGQSGVFRTTASALVTAANDSGSVIGAAAGRGSSAETRMAAAPARASDTTQSTSGERVRRANTAIVAAIVVAVAIVIVGAVWLRPRNAPPASSAEALSAPQSVRTQLAAATASLESKDYRAALGYAEEALRLSPDDRDAIRVREAARSILARFDEAVAQAGQRLAAGDTDGASSALNAARAIDPTAPILAELSARIAARTGATESARRDGSPTRAEAARQRPAEPPQPPARPAPAAPAPQESAPARPVPPPARESAAPSEPPAPAVVPSPPAQTQPAPAPAPRPAPPATPEPAATGSVAATRPETPERRDPPPTTPARPAETDDAAIRRVVATYARAIETKDLALFRSVKPNMSADEQRRVETGFRAVTSQQVGITIVSIEVKGQEAAVQLRRRDTIVAGGRQQTSESLQSMTLARAASGWVIREIGR